MAPDAEQEAAQQHRVAGVDAAARLGHAAPAPRGERRRDGMPGQEAVSRRDGRLPGLRPPLPQAEAAPHPALSRRERVFRGARFPLLRHGDRGAPAFARPGRGDAPAPGSCEMSCSVMFSMLAVMRCGRSGHGAAGSGPASPTFPTSVRTCREGRPGFISGVFRLRFPRVREDMSGHGVSPFRSRSVPSARRRRDPNSRVMRACACALGRAFRAGAVCAPDCPGAPPRASRAQGAARLSVESGAFSRRREPGREAAPRGRRFLPPAPYCD